MDTAGPSALESRVRCLPETYQVLSPLICIPPGLLSRAGCLARWRLAAGLSSLIFRQDVGLARSQTTVHTVTSRRKFLPFHSPPHLKTKARNGS